VLHAVVYVGSRLVNTVSVGCPGKCVGVQGRKQQEARQNCIVCAADGLWSVVLWLVTPCWCLVSQHATGTRCRLLLVGVFADSFGIRVPDCTVSQLRERALSSQNAVVAV